VTAAVPLPVPSARQALRELLVLAAPLIVVTTSRMLMGFIDVKMVAALGTPQLAAILPATMLMWACICFGIGMATSVQTFASQADGRGEPERAAAYAWQTVYFGLALLPLAYAIARAVPALYGLLDTAMSWLGRDFQHPTDVRALEIAYLRIAVWSMVPATIAAGFEGFFNGIQRPRVTLLEVTVSLVTIAVGNYVLIWGKFGFPALGIEGSAVATVIAWWVRVVLLFTVFCLPYYNRKYHTRRSYRPRWAMFGGICKVGGPTGLTWLIDISSWVVFLNVIIPTFGEPALAATNIAMQYTQLAFMPAIGLGMALCSQVGFAIGAGKPDEAALRTRLALGMTMAYMGIIGAALYVFRAPLVGWFTQDAEVWAIGVGIMIWVAVYQVFDAMSITFIFSLRGAGDTRTPAILGTVCCWGIFIGGAYLVARHRHDWGLHGPWLMAVTYLTVFGLLLLWRYRAGGWRKIQLFKDAGPGPAGGREFSPAAEGALAVPPEPDMV
jgi:multidrug resistance protein, MATE family